MIVKWKSIVPRRADRLVKSKSMGKVVNQANGTTSVDRSGNVGGRVSLRVDRNKNKGR